MGYESRLFVVNKTDMELDAYMGSDLALKVKYRWAERLATFNMCCLGNECYPLWSGEATDCTFCDEGGNEYITKDRYGKPLTENTVKDTIDVLTKAYKAYPYRRLLPVIAYLKFIDESEWDNVVVLHYGY